MFPSLQSIINCLRTQYDIDIAMLEPLAGGADRDALVYKAQTQDQIPYFVKLRRGDSSDVGVKIVELLQKSGIQQIILPIKTIDGQLIKHVEGGKLIVYPFIEGQDGFSRHLTSGQWVQLGRVLRQVHEVDIPSSIQNQLRRETYSPKWREAVAALYKNTTWVEDEVAIKLAHSLQEHASTIHRLVEGAHQLAQEIQTLSPPFVLCHSDIHGGNVLIDKEDNIYIVDWDNPILAPKERDLMFIGGGVANVWNNPQEEELFYQGYGKTNIDKRLLAYYRQERIVEDIALFGQQLLLTSEGEDRSQMSQHFMDMFQPRGVVDIALNTTL